MLLALCLVAMPNVWTGTTHDGVHQCKLNLGDRGLLAYVGKGGKKTTERVASQSTSLPECVAAMERVLDRSQHPVPLPADLYAVLCGLPLLAGNASKAVRANVVSILSLGNPRQHEHPASGRRPVSSRTYHSRRPLIRRGRFASSLSAFRRFSLRSASPSRRGSRWQMHRLGLSCSR